MSWFLDAIGPRAAVKAQILTNQTLPQGLKDVIVEVLTPNDKSIHDSARVLGQGHGGNDDWSGIQSLGVQLFTAVKEPTTPAS